MGRMTVHVANQGGRGLDAPGGHTLALCYNHHGGPNAIQHRIVRAHTHWVV